MTIYAIAFAFIWKSPQRPFQRCGISRNACCRGTPPPFAHHLPPLRTTFVPAAARRRRNPNRTPGPEEQGPQRNQATTEGDDRRQDAGGRWRQQAPSGRDAREGCAGGGAIPRLSAPARSCRAFAGTALRDGLAIREYPLTL